MSIAILGVLSIVELVIQGADLDTPGSVPKADGRKMLA